MLQSEQVSIGLLVPGTLCGQRIHTHLLAFTIDVAQLSIANRVGEQMHAMRAS
jgi:hypothetical protein